MKPETLALLKKHQDDKDFSAEFIDGKLHFNYTLTDEELKNIVEAEYGTSVTQSYADLFEAIVKKLIKMGIEYAKANPNGTTEF
jgi:hypothetical protein